MWGWSLREEKNLGGRIRWIELVRINRCNSCGEGACMCWFLEGREKAETLVGGRYQTHRQGVSPVGNTVPSVSIGWGKSGGMLLSMVLSHQCGGRTQSKSGHTQHRGLFFPQNFFPNFDCYSESQLKLGEDRRKRERLCLCWGLRTRKAANGAWTMANGTSWEISTTTLSSYLNLSTLLPFLVTTPLLS